MISLKGNKGVKLNRMPVVDTLTPSEKRVWDLHLSGKTKAEIGDALGLKINSVTARIRIAREKVQASAY